ncbi:hypothetical protein BGZ83_001751 [Gryganskiella cystojenkinii]|nr:hypothetical protein BGZ83_001751 [Gryganskiella cystojenkinii]
MIVICTLVYTILHLVLFHVDMVAHVFFSADLGTLLLYTLVPARIRTTAPNRSTSSTSTTATTTATTLSTAASSTTPANASFSSRTTSSSTPAGSQWVKASIIKTRFYILVGLATLWAIQPYQLTNVDLGGDTPLDLLSDSHNHLALQVHKTLNQRQLEQILHENRLQGKRQPRQHHQDAIASQFKDQKRNADLAAWAMQGLAVGALVLALLIGLEALLVWTAWEHQIVREQEEARHKQQQQKQKQSSQPSQAEAE